MERLDRGELRDAGRRGKAAEDERHMALRAEVGQSRSAAIDQGKIEVWCHLAHAHGSVEERFAGREIDIADVGVGVVLIGGAHLCLPGCERAVASLVCRVRASRRRMLEYGEGA